MRRLLTVLFSLPLATTAFAAAAPAHPPIRAVRLTAPVRVDGVLDEPVWSAPGPVTAFYQASPDQGRPASQQTEVRVAYDDAAIYVGARCFDAAPDSIIERLSRRDESVPADRFSVYLDPFRDKRTGYYFLVNCAGTQFDGTLSNDGAEDGSWDGVWEARVRRDPQGWTVEYRIPFSQLRFQNSSPQVWGVNFRRVIMRRAEETFLAYQPNDESGFVSRWPELVGLDGVRASRTVELLPYVTSKGEFVNRRDGDPFHDGSKYEPDGGFDLRTSLGSRLTLNATINPDFGQVEVDPATVNLSDVETFFQEKRPFFVEGASNFRFGNEGSNSYWNFNWPEPTFFYSRRVGRAPQGAVPDVQFAEIPIGTTILGAAKLTGKITQNTSFGTMHAVTSRERARLWDAGSEWRSDVEPLTYYGVSRGLRQFKDRKQGLGSMVSLVQRRFESDALEDQLNQTAALGALDGWFTFGPDQLWVVSGWAGATHVRGTRERITALQRDARHYYQRPDADHLGVDADATSLTGYGARFWLNKQRGKWFSNSGLGMISPGFELNDIGFQSRADVVNGHTVIGRRWSDPGRIRQYAQLSSATWGSTDFGGNLTSAGQWVGAFVEFRNRYSLESWNSYNPRVTSVRLTRGGPRVKMPISYENGFYFDTDGGKKVFWSAQFNRFARGDGSLHLNSNWSLELKPVSNLRFSVGPGWSHVVENAQYVETVADPAMIATYGNRYVFGRLEQTTISANLRLNWAFTPRMSLQTYVQPFISAGEYTGFKALARPNTFDFVPASATFNPDFNFKSLRGNAVFRWEYLPGSAFYLVWTQQRTDFVDDGDFSFNRDARQLFEREADNIFLAKMTYYFTL